MNPEANHNEETSAPLSRRELLTVGATSVAALAATQIAGANTLQPPQPRAGRANPNGRFAGKIVLITGATYGIGEGTARAFALEGATVHFCGRKEELGRKVEKSIRDLGGKASYQRADVTVPADVKAFAAECARRYGRIDIAFNNAGYFMNPQASPSLKPSLIQDISPEHWTTIMDTNTRGVLLAMQAEISQMLRQGGGVIVNMASVSGHVAFEQMGGYAASKHAVIGLTKVAALENAAKNIRVNSISPLAVDTPMIRASLGYYGVSLEQSAQGNPNKRIMNTEEIARAVMWLSSDDATSVTGMDLDVTGGWLTK
jgi:NAD(P)-dependent dehydrogenase (short-subunit alcohol dehydrogenase family)